VAQLTDMPKKKIWLQKQKTARARRLDIQHFVRTLVITTPDEWGQANHKAIIAWDSHMPERERSPSSIVRRRLGALTPLSKRLVRSPTEAGRPS